MRQHMEFKVPGVPLVAAFVALGMLAPASVSWILASVGVQDV